MRATISIPELAAYGNDESVVSVPPGMDPLTAANKMVKGRVEWVAKRLGMPKSTLHKKLAHSVDSHHLTAVELMKIQLATGDMAAAQAFAAAGGSVCIPNHPREASSVQDGITRLMVEVADLARALNEAGASGRGVSPNELRRAQHHLAEVIGSANAAVASLATLKGGEA